MLVLSFLLELARLLSRTIRFFLLFLLLLKMVIFLNEPSSLMTRKRHQFVIVNPQNMRVWVHLIKLRSLTHASDSSYTNYVPSAASPDNRKRKRGDDEEDSGTSKPSEPAAKEFSPKETTEFDPFGAAAVISS
jgi:hypothetical protein